MGTVRYSTLPGDSVTYRFRGNRVALISTKGRNHSQAMIFVDGKYKRLINTHSRTSRHRQVVYAQVFRRIGQHTIKVVNVGNRRRLDLDGLAVGR